MLKRNEAQKKVGKKKSWLLETRKIWKRVKKCSIMCKYTWFTKKTNLWFWEPLTCVWEKVKKEEPRWLKNRLFQPLTCVWEGQKRTFWVRPKMEMHLNFAKILKRGIFWKCKVSPSRYLATSTRGQSESRNPTGCSFISRKAKALLLSNRPSLRRVYQSYLCLSAGTPSCEHIDVHTSSR